VRGEQGAAVTAVRGIKTSPKSIKCFETPLRLRNGELTLPRSYIYCTRITPADPFRPFAERAKKERGWRYFEIDASHSPHITAPEKLAMLLGKVASEQALEGLKITLMWCCLMFVFVPNSFAQNPEKLKMPGPDVQNLMLGKWSTQVRYTPNPEMPNGGMGEGTEIWRSGPGGLSVIEEYHEKNEKGEVEGLGVAWWDAKAQGQRFVWCENSNPDGCYVSKEVGKWEEGSLVWKEEQESAGKKRVYSEVFRDITPTSFTQVLGEGEPGGALKTTVTIRATKQAQTQNNNHSGKTCPWPANLDGVKAAPETHKVIFENAHVRVLEVTIPPHSKEPVHTHCLPSTIYVQQIGDLIVRDADGKVIFDSRQLKENEKQKAPFVLWAASEGPHSDENPDDLPIKMIQIENKD
jgi:hypothetical protein